MLSPPIAERHRRLSGLDAVWLVLAIGCLKVFISQDLVPGNLVAGESSEVDGQLHRMVCRAIDREDAQIPRFPGHGWIASPPPRPPHTEPLSYLGLTGSAARTSPLACLEVSANG